MAMMPYGWPGRHRRSQDMQTSGTPHALTGVRNGRRPIITRLSRRCHGSMRGSNMQAESTYQRSISTVMIVD